MIGLPGNEPFQAKAENILNTAISEFRLLHSFPETPKKQGVFYRQKSDGRYALIPFPNMDKTQILEVGSGKQLIEIPGMMAVISPDGRLVASTEFIESKLDPSVRKVRTHLIRVFDMGTKKELVALADTEETARPTNISFSHRWK